MAHILALDQGTTSSRAVVFDDAGKPISIRQEQLEQLYPAPGLVEHDGLEIWRSQVATARAALAEARLAAGDVSAIGITNQRETTLLWDTATGEPIHHAIVWQDRRTAPMCKELEARGLGPLVRERSGLVIDPYFSGTKLRWLLDHVPGARARADAGALRFGTVDSWLVDRLTDGAVHVIDASNASRTMLFNIHSGAWDDELLGALGIPRAVLPKVVASSGVVGRAAVEGLEGIPIAGIAGDQQAALFGQVCLHPGMAKSTFGTGCFMLANTGSVAAPSSHRLLTTTAWDIGGVTSYALEGAVFVAGAIVQWLRDGLGVIERSEDIEPLAASTPDSGGVVLVPALTGLGAPHWDPHARGAILGLTRGSTKAHVARAALEGIAFSVADLAGAMAEDIGGPITELRVDGGAATNNLLMQLAADALQIPLLRPESTESTAQGAAFLAGLATGVWGSPTDLEACWRLERRFEPAMTASGAADRLDRWRDAVRRSSGWDRSEHA